MSLPNLVQLEFFHVGGNINATLESVLEECKSRTLDNLELALQGHRVSSGIKTVLRVYDERGGFSQIVHKAQALKSAELKDQKRWRWFRSDGRAHARKHIALRADALQLAKREVQSAFVGREPVALEVGDSLRFVIATEAHEVLERVKRSHGVWIFMFSHNEMLADHNQLVGSVM